MGYDTWFNINITTDDENERQAVLREIAKAAFDNETATNVVELGFEGHWYDCDEDLVAISRRHPGVLIEISGNGESSDDLWAARYLGGKTEKVRYEGLPDFRNVLTPQEKERAFDKAWDAYRDALNEMRLQAGRRIRAVKQRITGREDCHLSFRRLNEKFAQLVLSQEAHFVSNGEWQPAIVEGIQDDGETLCTDDGDPIGLSEMIPGQIRDVITCVEDFERDLAKGTIKGRWDEEKEWFKLYWPEPEEAKK